SPDDSIFSSEFDLTIPKPGPRGSKRKWGYSIARDNG
ncbi:unnamed protein product, partial [Allacma fusca]